MFLPYIYGSCTRPCARSIKCSAAPCHVIFMKIIHFVGRSKLHPLLPHFLLIWDSVSSFYAWLYLVSSVHVRVRVRLPAVSNGYVLEYSYENG